jgi:hypothetical protein
MNFFTRQNTRENISLVSLNFLSCNSIMSSTIETSSFEVHSLHELSSRYQEQTVQPPPAVNDIDDTAAGEMNYQHLHPVDRGFAAWRLLFTAFIFESLLWGES